MKNIYAGIIIMLFAGLNLNAQIPCTDGFATFEDMDFPCSGYDLMSGFTLDDMGITGNGNDCWGWTDPETGVEYAIMGGSNRTVFIDISDPTAPIIMGYLPTATSSSLWRDIKVYQDHAFIVSEASGHGMQVFDLTRLRDDFAPPMEFDADAWLQDFGHAHNIAINEETGYAYPIGTSGFSGGPHFINIQDPVNPVSEGGYDGDGYSHDAQIIIYNGPDEEHQCKEVYFGFNENSLTIVDVTDKSDPIQISRTEYEMSAYTHQGWINEDRTLVYMNDEIDEQNFGFNTRTLIMDVSDLDNPFLTEEHFGVTTSIDHNMYVHGDKLFQSNYTSGLRVLQISDDPENLLEEVGFFDVDPANDNPNFAGTWSNYPYFESGNIIISAFGAFFIVNSSTIMVNEVDPVLVDCSTGINEIEKVSFSLYPNPVTTVLNLSTDGEKVIESIVITDIVGQEVYFKSELKIIGRHQIEINNFAPGTYFVSVNGLPVSEKFIVE